VSGWSPDGGPPAFDGGAGELCGVVVGAHRYPTATAGPPDLTNRNDLNPGQLTICAMLKTLETRVHPGRLPARRWVPRQAARRPARYREV